MHNYLRYEALGNSLSQAYTGPLTRWMNSVWCNELMVDYFRTGSFRWSIPFGSAIVHEDGEPPPLDWFGINYYSRLVGRRPVWHDSLGCWVLLCWCGISQCIRRVLCRRVDTAALL